MNTHLRRKRGLAVMVIIALFTLITAAVVSMTLVFAAQAQRTRATQGGTQLRQLLLASAPIAQQELESHGSTARSVPVTVPVEGATLTLQIAPTTQSHVEVQVIADWRHLQSRQKLMFTSTAGNAGAARWQLDDAQLVLDPR